MTLFTFLLILLDGLFIALGASLIWRRREARKPVWLRDLTIAAGAGACMASLSLAGSYLHMSMGHSWFSFFFKGAVFFTHAVFIVPPPLLILSGALHLQNHRILGALFITSGILVGSTFLYARYVEPYRLQIQRYSITTEHVERPVRILVLSDLQTDHIGDFEAEVFQAMDQERADLILLTGDFIQLGDHKAYMEEVDKLRTLFKGLKHHPPHGIFAVEGHADRSSMSLSGTGIPILNNEAHGLDGDQSIQLIGLTPGMSQRPLDGSALELARQFEGLTILFAHTPDFALSLLDGTVEDPLICVAGHTHGGQIVIPGFGPPVTFSRLPRQYAGGFHPVGNGWLIVSRGVGMERYAAPRLRLFCPPELVVIELIPATS